MSVDFITNKDRILSEVINNILPSSQNLFFLVGYFYLSGFKEIAEGVKDKHLRLLIGMDLERTITQGINEVNFLSDLNKARGEIKNDFMKSLVGLYNESDVIDNTDSQVTFRMFLDKIKDGTLQIRKTKSSNHAKLYLFENKPEHSQGGEYPGTLITGSSNLTGSGLRHQGEINVVFRDKTYNEGIKHFNALWENAVNIVDKNNFDDFYTEVIEKIWIDKLPKPYLLYIRVLIEYFKMYDNEGIKLPGTITDGKFMNLKYQSDAIQQAIDVMNQHNGVIIADVVGLGKSIIASAIAHNLNSKVIVICPPHLKDQWDDYLEDFRIVGRIFTSGKIEDAYKYNEKKTEQKLIIIDEAHKYRNEETNDYAMLHKLCQKNKVMLLTATPFNNRPQDIFSMIKLFQIPTRSTIQSVDNLSDQFREMVKEYKEIQKSRKDKNSKIEELTYKIQRLADKIRNLISPLVIRRSRIDLDQIELYKQDLTEQKIKFPKVNPPEECYYKLDGLTELYKNTLEKIYPEDDENSGFIGVRYKPVFYLKDEKAFKERIAKEFQIVEDIRQAQVNLAGFMRRLLVHRFESSMNSFKKSLDSLIESSVYVRDWYNNFGKVPIYKKGNLPDLERLEQLTGDDVDDELKDINFNEELKSYLERGLVIINADELNDSFIKDLNADIQLLEEIRDDWFKDGFPYDPKLEFIKSKLNELRKANKSRKIVIFSEYADTVNYVYENLKTDFRIFNYTSGVSSKENKNIIKRNFDAGLAANEQENDYDILIASDAISEGYNLHRAGVIFNYDIPYNPTRVIQRVGRINRINKKVFDELYIYNFFPTDVGEKETSIKKITTLKMAMIHALIGEDTKILTSDEELRSYFVDAYNKKAKEFNEQASWDNEFINFLNNLKNQYPELIAEAEKIPRRVRIRRVSDQKPGILIFGKKGNQSIFKFSDYESNEISNLLDYEAFKILKSLLSEDAYPVSENFEERYQSLKTNLFRQRTTYPVDRPRQEALTKIRFLIDKMPERKDYLEDLYTVVKEYDSLVERHLKMIRKISSTTFERDVVQLFEEVPQQYLTNIINKANSIDDAEEVLIFSEEFKK